MDEELKQVLFRVLPFLAVLLGVAVGLGRGKVSMDELCIRRPVTYGRLLLWWGGFTAFAVAAEVTLHHFGLLRVSPWEGTFLPSTLKVIGIVILAPVAEELAFRGLLLSRLAKWGVSQQVAIILQAALFVAIHSMAFEFTLLSSIGKAQIFADALLFAFARYSTKSIYTPMVMHATGNLVAVLEQFIL